MTNNGQLGTNENLRRAPRSPITGIYTLCWQAEDGAAHSAEAHGKDSSPFGICVRSGAALARGTTVFVQGAEGSQTGYATIRHCTAVNGHYELGLEFGGEPVQTEAAPEDVDYYEFMQISPKAGQETIQRVYRFMAARFHPDNAESGDLEKFLLLNRAYERLSNPERRSAYDASREQRAGRHDPIFNLSTFVNGVEGEVNRRLAILALLYNKRRASASEPGMSLWDLEQKMSMPREYLDFAVWYLKSKGYIAMADNSELTLTVSGVDYVEANADKDVTLEKLLHASSKTVMDKIRQEHPAGVLKLDRAQTGGGNDAEA